MKQPSPQVAASRLKNLSRLRPTLAIVLGSGFHSLLKVLDAEAEIPYSSIPGFPPMGVRGHGGVLYFGRLGGTPAIVLGGRAHFHEGHSMERVTFAVRVLAELGIRDLVLTNAAGGINPDFRRGDFMLLTDHINLMGTNPLRGCGDEASLPHPATGASQLLPRFVDLTQVYDSRLSKMLLKAASTGRVKLQRGVYLALSGPSYETPAEIRAFAKLGADAVGMSTVPEAIVARQCGLNVAGLSCITNMAAGISKGPLSHEEVLETGERAGARAAKLLETFGKIYGKG